MTGDSASRKAMLPVFQRLKSLLWYPVQFEGNECSPNIMYSGAQPNQQIVPALTWAEGKGYKSYFLIGSDYVFPRTANLILSHGFRLANVKAKPVYDLGLTPQLFGEVATLIDGDQISSSAAARWL